MQDGSTGGMLHLASAVPCALFSPPSSLTSSSSFLNLCSPSCSTHSSHCLFQPCCEPHTLACTHQRYKPWLRVVTLKLLKSNGTNAGCKKSKLRHKTWAVTRRMRPDTPSLYIAKPALQEAQDITSLMQGVCLRCNCQSECICVTSELGL